MEENEWDKMGRNIKTNSIYDEDGYDYLGYDRNGFNKDGIHKVTNKAFIDRLRTLEKYYDEVIKRNNTIIKNLKKSA